MAGRLKRLVSLATFSRNTNKIRPKVHEYHFTWSKSFIFAILIVPTATWFRKIHERFCTRLFYKTCPSSLPIKIWRPMTSGASLWVCIHSLNALRSQPPGKHGGQFLEGTHLLLRVLLHFPLHHSGGAGFHAFQEADAKVKSEITWWSCSSSSNASK